MKNKVQLIAYVERMGGTSIADFSALLEAQFSGLFGAVHLLPFYHVIDGVDAGFDPIDHRRVDARLGDWSDIEVLSHQVDVMADVIINHVSCESPQFVDYQQNGEKSRYSGMFLTPSTVFPEGPTEADLRTVYRPRPGSPFSDITFADGTKKTFWTTFTPQQIDINVNHPEGTAYLDSILGELSANGVKMIRLDAVGYAIKKAGTSCFMMPETFTFIDEFAAKAKALNLQVLVEIHSYYQKQIEIAKRVDWVYDFALPPLVLHSIFFRTARYLKHWISERPVNSITVLDTHDGIGIIDIGADVSDRTARPGLVPTVELDQLVEMIHHNSGGQSREATGAAASNLDLYQVNCTFYDALGRDDKLYLMARAIQFFLPGIPQVYYVGLLAGGNDMDLLRATGVGRDINRHFYSKSEIVDALNKPVVQSLIKLIHHRNSHPAFAGHFSVIDNRTSSELTLTWTHGRHFTELELDFSNRKYMLRSSHWPT
jgi:sucrose phosphorylase